MCILPVTRVLGGCVCFLKIIIFRHISFEQTVKLLSACDVSQILKLVIYKYDYLFRISLFAIMCNKAFASCVAACDQSALCDVDTKQLHQLQQMIAFMCDPLRVLLSP